MFLIEFTDTRGAKQLLERERYSFHERAVAEAVAEHLRSTNNPAWQGQFEVIDGEKA